MKKDPTYHSIGDHTETIQIDYDPGVISYSELVNIFWNSHDASRPSWSRQYMSIIFVHDSEQEKIARKTQEQQSEETGRKIQTVIVPYREFYLAEAYHQKYCLKMEKDILEEYRKFYPDWKDMTDSTSAARVNGYLAGEGDPSIFAMEEQLLGLSERSLEKIRKTLSQY